MTGWLGAMGALVTVAGVIVTGWFTYRGTRAAAAPQEQQSNLAVLQATVGRVDSENQELRKRQSRLEAVVRAFARTTDRWRRQMELAGIEPEPADPLVEEYNRTGV